MCGMTQHEIAEGEILSEMEKKFEDKIFDLAMYVDAVEHEIGKMNERILTLTQKVEGLSKTLAEVVETLSTDVKKIEENMGLIKE